MIFIEKSVEERESDYITEDFQYKEEDPFLIFLESGTDSHYMLDELYPVIKLGLSNQGIDRRFKQLIGNFIDRNNDKLRTPGPQYMIPFTDKDKEEFFTLFGLNAKDITNIVNKITKDIGSGSDFLYLKQNPIFWLLVCCIRYYTVVKDTKGLNTTLAMYALAVYPSIFNKYFTYGVSSPGTMVYTIDQLTNKYIFKQQGHLFGALTFSIQQSYKFLKAALIEGSDKEFIRWIQRIRNDQNSMIKKIANQYTINHSKGLTVSTALDTGEGGEIIDSYVNDTSQVETTVQAIMLPMITNGINVKYVTAAAQMCQISISELRYCLSLILVDEQSPQIKKFIESILFLWLYDEKKTRKEINSSEFFMWCVALFKKTNSNNENIRAYKEILNYWGEYCGIQKKFNREPTRINYKKAIYFYFILMIQYYNH